MEFATFPARWAQVASACAALAIAGVVYFQSPSRAVNRRLALLLVAQGIGLLAGWGLSTLAMDPRDAYAWGFVGAMGYGALIPLHLLFLATLPTPIVRPFATRPARWILALAAVAIPVWLLARPDFVGEPTPTPGVTSVWSFSAGPVYAVFPIVHGLLSLYALIAAIDVVRRSRRGTTTRRQALAYAVAFGWRDATWVLFLFVFTPIWFPDIARWWGRHYILAAMDLAFVVLVAYGALKFQLLNIDLRVKWGVRRGAVLAAFLAVFVGVAQVAESYLSGQFGLLAGGIAAALLVLAIRPLERAADRIAEATMPRVQDTAEYRLVRRHELYRAALESARADGEITPRERDILVTLAERLGLSVREVHEIENALAR